MPQGLDSDMILNKILYAGQPNYQEMEVETAETIAPGRLLIKGTAQYQCAVAGATTMECIGVADVMADRKLTLMQTETAAGTPLDTYDAGDQIRVIRGDVIVKLLLLSGQTITVGERVEAAANGMCQTETGDGSGAAVGYAVENSTAPATCCEWILVKLII
jgi:predicted RecA/RadA family phage recombinase